MASEPHTESHSDFALSWVKPLPVTIPLIKRPYAEEELHVTATWWPYPQRGFEIMVAEHGLLDVRINLYEIGIHIIPVLMSGSPDESPLPGHIILEGSEKLTRLGELEQMLHDWHQRLPSYARIHNREESLPSAALIDLQ